MIKIGVGFASVATGIEAPWSIRSAVSIVLLNGDAAMTKFGSKDSKSARPASSACDDPSSLKPHFLSLPCSSDETMMLSALARLCPCLQYGFGLINRRLVVVLLFFHFVSV